MLDDSLRLRGGVGCVYIAEARVGGDSGDDVLVDVGGGGMCLNAACVSHCVC